MPKQPDPRRAREGVNWVIQWCGPTLAKAIEPGGGHEWRFEGMPYPYDAATAFAAARLRGDALP